MNNKIEVEHLTKIFGSKPEEGLKQLEEGKSKDEILENTGMTVGVKEASFSVKEGEIFVIMGLSGSGKSTLIRLVNRLIDPTAGRVMIDGEDLTTMDNQTLLETRRAKLGMVFQKFGLFPFRTILNNVEYGLEIQGVPKEEREQEARKAIDDVGLKGYEKQYPSQLSGGMQQRVGLARALANDTDILLMDEAFSALDPLIRQEMQDELIDLQEKLNKTVLFITHDLDEALKLGDRIAIMKDGEIVQVGTAEEILDNPANDYVSSFVKDVDRSKVLEASNVMKIPEVTASFRDGPRMAIRKMKESNMSSIFVTGKNKHLMGLLTIDDAIHVHQNNESMETVLKNDFPRTAPDTQLKDLIAVASDAKYPITVVEDGKLLGLISRASILSGLVFGQEQETEHEEVHA
ncbi:quaternary amine ABC transporter ATP-binding protein [Texcoconibacillus texcoconensis]|uniref:Quaternary amine transport ATP-binding protein n=1 Tax=Texcoconibacillus texcoconensis TaxID=1095777 RepID=A0A840QLS9_9BACI|nr:glycine betaine/L-proline ABC transporter ATP-binding protein [Texcoconibacillus texcoconensis]MBB5172329.1 glycine betaine/proline transport system ATP-binding protein [Texcoconibacillus texcoconensis]